MTDEQEFAKALSGGKTSIVFHKEFGVSMEDVLLNTRTDKEKLTNLLTEFGVEWREKVDGIKCGGYAARERVTGYQRFYTLFEFYDNGDFKQMGAWE